MRGLEYALVGVSFLSVVLSLVLIADAFRDTIYIGTRDGLSAVIAAAALRSEAYRFGTQIAFFSVGVSFVANPVPNPLPPGTTERVALFAFGAFLILVNSLDSYRTKRHLLRST